MEQASKMSEAAKPQAQDIRGLLGGLSEQIARSEGVVERMHDSIGGSCNPLPDMSASMPILDMARCLLGRMVDLSVRIEEAASTLG